MPKSPTGNIKNVVYGRLDSVRLTWHEAVVKQERLIIRWPAEEKRLRTVVFVPVFAAVAGIVLNLLRISVSQEMQRDAVIFGMILAFTVFLYGCFTIWFSHIWVLDKQQNALLAAGGASRQSGRVCPFHRQA
jgi:hypothetical protein